MFVASFQVEMISPVHLVWCLHPSLMLLRWAYRWSRSLSSLRWHRLLTHQSQSLIPLSNSLQRPWRTSSTMHHPLLWHHHRCSQHMQHRHLCQWTHYRIGFKYFNVDCKLIHTSGETDAGLICFSFRKWYFVCLFACGQVYTVGSWLTRFFEDKQIKWDMKETGICRKKRIPLLQLLWRVFDTTYGLWELCSLLGLPNNSVSHHKHILNAVAQILA